MPAAMLAAALHLRYLPPVHHTTCVRTSANRPTLGKFAQQPRFVHCSYYCSCLPPSVPCAVCMSLVLPWQLVATMLRRSRRRLCHALMAQGHTAPSLTDTSTAATSNSLLPASLSAFINGPTAGVPSTQLGQTIWAHNLQGATIRPTGACSYSMASWIQQRALTTSTTSNSSSSEDKPSGSGRSQPPPSVAAAATASSSLKARRGSQAAGVHGNSPDKPVWLHIIMRKRKKREAVEAELEARKARRRKQGTGRQFPPGPAELTAQIMKARSVEALHTICSCHAPGGIFQNRPLSPMHVTAAFSQLTRLLPSLQPDPEVDGSVDRGEQDGGKTTSHRANSRSRGMAESRGGPGDAARAGGGMVVGDTATTVGGGEGGVGSAGEAEAAEEEEPLDSLSQLKQVLCLRLFQVAEKLDVVGTCHVVWCLGKLRLHSEHALVEELQRHLCERELVLVTEVQGRRGARAGDASPDGIEDRRHDGKHVPKTWVPRVYTAPADSLVRLATGLSWLGVRLTPGWQPVLAAIQRQADSGSLSLRQLAVLLLELRRCAVGWNAPLLDSLAARFVDCLPGQLLMLKGEEQPLWALATCCHNLHLLGAQSERLAHVAADATRQYLRVLAQRSRPTDTHSPAGSHSATFPLAALNSSLLKGSSETDPGGSSREAGSDSFEADEGLGAGARLPRLPVSGPGDRHDRRQLCRALFAWNALDAELRAALLWEGRPARARPALLFGSSQ